MEWYMVAILAMAMLIASATCIAITTISATAPAAHFVSRELWLAIGKLPGANACMHVCLYVFMYSYTCYVCNCIFNRTTPNMDIN